MNGLYDDISVGFSLDVVFVFVSVATVYTRCMKSFNLLDLAEVVVVHRTFDVSKCGVITGIHCNFVGVEKVTP